jgi:hypothetical protein
MPIVLTDAQIAELLHEHKQLPEHYRRLLSPRTKRGHRQSELDVDGKSGSRFRLIVRQSEFDPLDFSVILAYYVPRTNVLFRLRRYNGKSTKHTNRIEGTSFYDFHVHMATERYQMQGFDEDAYAEPTGRYSDLRSALGCLVKDCGFEFPSSSRMVLL